MNSQICQEFVAQDFAALPEGVSEMLDINGIYVLVSRDPFRPDQFCITLVNDAAAQSVTCPPDDITDHLEQAVNLAIAQAAGEPATAPYHPVLE